MEVVDFFRKPEKFRASGAAARQSLHMLTDSFGAAEAERRRMQQACE